MRSATDLIHEIEGQMREAEITAAEARLAPGFPGIYLIELNDEQMVFLSFVMDFLKSYPAINQAL